MTPRAKQYVQEAAVEWGTTPDRVLSHSRKGEDVQARRAVWKRLRSDGFSFSQIGRWTGFDHTTIMHGVSRS